MANADLLDIWNGALGYLGAKTSISATTEQSAEAAACALHYRRVVEKIVRETDWNCLRRRRSLDEVPEGAVWPPSWRFMYKYPADCIAVRGFDFGWDGQSILTVLPHEVADDAEAGKVLLVNVCDPTLIYTSYVSDMTDAAYEAKFDASLRDAVTWALAAAIAGPISANAQLMASARTEANRSLLEAQAANAGERTQTWMDDSAESLKVRGFVDYDRYPGPPWRCC